MHADIACASFGWWSGRLHSYAVSPIISKIVIIAAIVKRRHSSAVVFINNVIVSFCRLLDDLDVLYFLMWVIFIFIVDSNKCSVSLVSVDR